MENIKKIKATSQSFYARYEELNTEIDKDGQLYNSLEHDELQDLILICGLIDREYKGLMCLVHTGHYLKQIRDKKYYEHADYNSTTNKCKNISEFAKQYCGLSQTFCYTLISIAERFYISEFDMVGIKIAKYHDEEKCSKDTNNEIKQKDCIMDYRDLSSFSISKLQELLALSDDYILKYVIDCELTVEQLRTLVASLKYDLKEAKQSEDKHNQELDKQCESIPVAYDPKQYYKFEYFKNKTKDQLINIVWEMQKTYVKK